MSMASCEEAGREVGFPDMPRKYDAGGGQKRT